MPGLSRREGNLRNWDLGFAYTVQYGNTFFSFLQILSINTIPYCLQFSEVRLE